MWSIEKLTKSNEWEKLEKIDSFENIIQSLNKLSDSDGTIYVFKDGEFPEDKKELEKIMKDFFEINKGKVIRVFPNTKIDIGNKLTRCGCPSRCFCEWDNGKCSCWTSRCRPEGCYWVKCNGKC